MLLVATTLLCLAPFIGKAFNIDEPLFIWTAKHLQSHPLDFYGFNINWYGTDDSSSDIIKNPPLASYYIALAGFIGGWSEISLHIAFILPAVAGVLGTYFLSRELSDYPLSATLISLLTPVFILSGTTVMCDTMMMSMYVWAIYLWIKGLKFDCSKDLIYASLLIALCSLTKYFGITLIPLLVFYTVRPQHVKKQRILFLLIPIFILCCYHVATKFLYGKGLLIDAVSFAHGAKPRGFKSIFLNFITGFSFLGGCFIPVLLYIPIQIRKRFTILLSLVALFTICLYKISFQEILKSVSWDYYLQLSIYIITGFHLLAIAVNDLLDRRDSESLLLFLWVSGTFLFASFINWGINGRSILPMTPAIGILIVRSFGREGFDAKDTVFLRSRLFAMALTCAWLISMTIAWADYRLADSARSAAEEIMRDYGKEKVLFQGHWGFQYYMEQNGAKAYGKNESYAKPLIMVIPKNNANLFDVYEERILLLQILHKTPLPFLTCMNEDIHAGFYSNEYGELPFAFGNVPDEVYKIVKLL